MQEKIELLAQLAAPRQQLSEVADVRRHALQFLRNIAALDHDCNLFQQPLAVELRPHGRLQPLAEPRLIALFNLGAHRRHAFRSLGQAVERSVQDRLQRLALARPHLLQLLQQRLNLPTHALGERGLILAVVRAVLALQGAGEVKNRIQIRLASEMMFLASRRKGSQVARHQFAVVAGRGLAAAINLERQIDVATNQRILERLAQLHLQRVQARGQAQLHIEKAVIDALQAERVTQLAVVRQRHANLCARKSGHRIDWHSSFLKVVSLLIPDP